VLKKLVVTQNSLMAFNPSSKIFTDCDLKIIFEKHDAFYIRREDFIKNSNMEDKEQVGYLNNSYKFILALACLPRKEYHLVGCGSELQAKRLLSALTLANRYQELLGLSNQMTYPVDPYYLEFIIDVCNNSKVPFIIKPKFISCSQEELFLNYFLDKGEFVENIVVEGFDLTAYETEKLTAVFISIPQQQIKHIEFIK
jgi:hypothetical protein